MAEEFNLSIYNDVYDMSFNQETEEVHIELKEGYYPLSNNVDLSNYYTKTETYNKNEVNSLISNIDVDLSNYYNKSESDSRYKSINYIPTWGEIQGNIINQTDLIQKFGNYVPYEGADKDINLSNAIKLYSETSEYYAYFLFNNDGVTSPFYILFQNKNTFNSNLFMFDYVGFYSDKDYSEINPENLKYFAQRQYVHNIAETKADLVDGKVPASQLPSYVDDVLEFSNLSSFPAIGESGKIYIALDSNLTYRWGGSSYVVMSSSLALGETSSTAYRGDRGKIAYDHSQVTHDKNLVGLGNVDNTSDAEKNTATVVLKNKTIDGGTY